MKFILKDMEKRGLDSFGIPRVTIDPTGNIRPMELSENRQFRLAATLEVFFWANDAQLSHARETALLAVMHKFHEPILRLLPRLQLAVSDGNREECRRLIGLIESACKEII